MNNLFKKITKIIFFIVIIIILTGFSRVRALEPLQLETLGIDRSILREDNNFTIPYQIVVIPIFKPTLGDTANLTTKAWIKGIYYYIIQRLGFSDIPFHYLLTEDGNVFKGNSGGDERKINIAGIGENLIVVGYLANEGSTKFSKEALNTLENLLIQICNNNSIKPEEISVSGLLFQKDKENKTVSMNSKEIFGLWEQNLNQIIVNITPKFQPIKKTYNMEILSVELPNIEVEPGEELIGSIKVKNKSISGIYSGSNNEIVLSRKDATTSSFFINDIWLSRSQISLMAENQTLLPEGEAKFDFRIKAPLTIGQVSENFELKTISGDALLSSSVQIVINVKRTNKQIVEVKQTELGYANIREEPSTSSNILLKASTGERFFLLEQNNETLWARIDLGNNRSGWVALWLLNYL